MSWTTFWFETNSAWGLVDSPEAWKAMRENWNKGAARIHTHSEACI